MSNIKPDEPPAIDLSKLHDITGGCRTGGCYGLGGVAYTQQTGFGIDPLFVLFAMTLFSQINKT